MALRNLLPGRRLSREDVRRLLAKAVKEAGDQYLWARNVGVDQSYISKVLTGRRQPGPRICAALGIERVITVTYRIRPPPRQDRPPPLPAALQDPPAER